MANKRMVKRTRLRGIYVATDFVTTFVAFLLFDLFRYYFIPDTSAYATIMSYLLSPTLLIEQLTLPVGMLGVYWLSGYYNIPEEKSRMQEIVTTAASSAINALLIFMTLLLNDHMGRRAFDYELLITLWTILFVLPYAGRLTVTTLLRRNRQRMHQLPRVAIAGNHKNARKMEQRLALMNRGRLDYDIVGYLPIDDKNSADKDSCGLQTRKDYSGSKDCIGTGKDCCLSERQFAEMVEAGDIDQVIVAPGSGGEKAVMRALSMLFPYNLPIRLAPDDLSFMTSSIREGNVMADPLVDLSRPSLSECTKNMKRTADVVLSAIALVALSPVYIVLAAMVKLGSKGPVFYSQERVGLHSRPFRIYKFRSMRTDAEKSGPQLSSEDDPRVTPTGRILRKYRLDELPQFWNVLRGDMSLVGPRPEREHFITAIKKRMPQYTLLHQVRPGVTSWGMVKYGYAQSVDEMIERARYDMIYLANMSMSTDLKILIHTVKIIVTGRGM